VRLQVLQVLLKRTRVLSQLVYLLLKRLDRLDHVQVLGCVLWLLKLVSSLNRLGALQFPRIGLPQHLHFLYQSIHLLLQFEQIVFLCLVLLNFLHFLLHLSDLHISGNHLLLQQTIFLGQFGQLVLNCCDLLVFFQDLFLRHFDVLNDGEIVVLGHVNHVVDILNLLIHVDGHGGHNFPDVLCALLVMVFHEVVFLQDAL
jgi:hypothetical protein